MKGKSVKGKDKRGNFFLVFEVHFNVIKVNSCIFSLIDFSPEITVLSNMMKVKKMCERIDVDCNKSMLDTHKAMI